MDVTIVGRAIADRTRAGEDPERKKGPRVVGSVRGLVWLAQAVAVV